ncbi:MAG: S8 family serine peptidase [Pyrinomonadaceae bacterium]|nr:S8 family serine peptidase [Pyrinomonadaceae bacterium]
MIRIKSRNTLTRLIALVALVLAIGLVAIQPARMQDGSDAQSRITYLVEEAYVPNQVIVALMPNFDIATVAAMYGLNPVPISQTGAVPPSYLMQIADGSTVEQKVAQLSADTLRIDFAEPNFRLSAPEAARPTWSVGDSYSPVAAGRKASNGQWARGVIRLDEAHQVTRGTAMVNGQPTPVVVAVLDTGIDFNHPAFAGRLVPGYDFIGQDNDPSEEGNPQIGPFGHGTHVAGIIAMVAPEAKIMPLRVLNVQGRTDAFIVARAVEYAVAHGAHVINLSLSTSNETGVIHDAFYDFLEGQEELDGGNLPLNGAVAVVAAGNTGTTAYQYPAAIAFLEPNRIGREVIPVAASNSSDVLSIFSSRGPWVFVMAPGERIISPAPYNRYANWSGTSMAAPIVAGEAALVRAVNPLAEAKDIQDHIFARTVNIPGQIRRVDVMLAVSNPIPLDTDRALPVKSRR